MENEPEVPDTESHHRRVARRGGKPYRAKVASAEVASRQALRRAQVAVLHGDGLSNPDIARRLGVDAGTVKADLRALLAALADDDAALMARRDLAERVAILALAQLEDLNAQVNARFELPEQDPPTIPTTDEP